MQRLWFKAKRFGWGWRPISWQGWLVTLAYTVLLVGGSLYIDDQVYFVGNTIVVFAIYFTILTIPMMAICYKTGERPRWRWSWKDTDEN